MRCCGRRCGPDQTECRGHVRLAGRRSWLRPARHNSSGLQQRRDRRARLLHGYCACGRFGEQAAVWGDQRTLPSPPWTKPLSSTPSNRPTNTNPLLRKSLSRPSALECATLDNAHMQTDRPRKLQRISQACTFSCRDRWGLTVRRNRLFALTRPKGDLCHRRSIRCRPSAEETGRCQNCFDFDVACTFERPSKRRKHPNAPATPHAPDHQRRPPPEHSTSQSSSTGLPSLSDASGNLVGPSHGGVDLAGSKKGSGGRDSTGAYLVMQDSQNDTLSVAWKAFALSCETTIFGLIDVYMEVVWPLYPLFDEGTLKKRIQARDHLSDEGRYHTLFPFCPAWNVRRGRSGALSIRCAVHLYRVTCVGERLFTALVMYCPLCNTGCRH